jgi:O-antigen/teichoic acid export membrane protein
MLFVYKFGAYIFLNLLHYEEYDNIVTLLIIASILTSAIGIYAQKGLEVVGNTLLMAKTAISVILASLILNFVTVSHWGIKSMAAINVFSQVLYLFAVYLFARKHLRLRVKAGSILLMTAFCTLLSLLLLLMNNVNIVFQISFFISILIAIFLVLPETRSFINQFFGLATRVFTGKRNN